MNTVFQQLRDEGKEIGMKEGKETGVKEGEEKKSLRGDRTFPGTKSIFAREKAKELLLCGPNAIAVCKKLLKILKNKT